MPGHAGEINTLDRTVGFMQGDIVATGRGTE